MKVEIFVPGAKVFVSEVQYSVVRGSDQDHDGMVLLYNSEHQTNMWVKDSLIKFFPTPQPTHTLNIDLTFEEAVSVMANIRPLNWIGSKVPADEFYVRLGGLVARVKDAVKHSTN